MHYSLKILTVLLFIPVICFGQKDSTKIKPSICISFNAGWGIPQSISKSNEGLFERYGQGGQFLNLAASIPIKHSIFGIACMVGYGTNPIDLSAIFTNETGLPSSTSTTENLNEYIGMAGPCISIPYHHFIFDFRLMIGVFYFQVPGNENEYSSASFQVISQLPNPTYVIQYNTNAGINPDSNTSLAIDLGACIKFLATKHIFITGSVDYFYAHPNIPYTVTVGNSVSNNIPNNITYTNYKDAIVDVKQINITVGLGYKF